MGEPFTFREDLGENNIAVLGHEIRNPLSALTYALQAWPSSKDDQQLEQCLLQIMRRQVKQLTRLCNDMLEAGQSGNGRVSIYRELMDIRHAVQNACEEVQPFAKACGNTLTAELGMDPVTVLGDESRLTQVFANLIHNASKFTDLGGHIHISIQHEDDSVLIRLCDNGRGMCKERIKSIFRKDVQSRYCRQLDGEGLGIGLQLAKKIVELHQVQLKQLVMECGLEVPFWSDFPCIIASDRMTWTPQIDLQGKVLLEMSFNGVHQSACANSGEIGAMLSL